jgi:hypothetical protein
MAAITNPAPELQMLKLHRDSAAKPIIGHGLQCRIVDQNGKIDRDTKGLLLRALHKHCRPGNRLKDNPVQPNRQRKRKDQQ